MRTGITSRPHAKRLAVGGNPNLTSAFEDQKEYELTQLGNWFVHYTMNEVVPRLQSDPAAGGSVPESSSA
jgi:hypothetical protein